jgi:hypothetical protein
MKRVFFDILFVLSVFVLPWWVTLLIGMIGLFIFISYYEFIAVSVIAHTLYVVPSLGIFSLPFWFCVLVVFIFISVQVLRRYIIFYKQ